MFPDSAVIVGGSVAGLLQGLQLKRNGSEVTILEQDPSQNRQKHESGVTIGPTVVALLERYDATGCVAAIPARFLSAAWRKRPRVLNMIWPHNLSNWGYLYLILRANFDGLASEAVPSPPSAQSSDGSVSYRAGKRVVGLSYDQAVGKVTVRFVDVVTGDDGSVVADTVIAADGVHSTVRELMQVPTRRMYAGYVGWRGTVPEHSLTAKTIEYFSNRLNFSLMKGSYFISYFVPCENGGDTGPGKRLINWVWYYPVPDNSLQMATIFTDIHGKLHPTTVPQGLVNPEVWSQYVAKDLPKMIGPLAEVVTKTPRVFVTKVGEAQCGRPSYYDGHVILVGDAFTSFRSHLGMASEQAARHCLQMERVWKGEITLAEREEEATFYADRFILLNRLMGFIGLQWTFSILNTAVSYYWLVAKHRVRRMYYAKWWHGLLGTQRN